MESSIRMRKFKYGEKSVTLTLLDNNTYIKYKKNHHVSRIQHRLVKIFKPCHLLSLHNKRKTI